MSPIICPMLSALPAADASGQPVNRECLYEGCRFFDGAARDCGLGLAAAATGRLAAAAGQPDPALQAALAQAGHATDRIVALESTVTGLASALARLESQMASIIEVQQKVADRLLEEMSLLLTRTEKGEQAVVALSGQIDRAEAGSRAAIEAIEVRRKSDLLDLEARRRDEAVVLNNRGVALYYRGAHEAARDAFRKAIEERADYGEAWNNLGLVESRLGREKEAIEAFRKALEADPKMGEAYNNLGFLYHTQAQYDRAAQMFHLAIESACDSAVAYANLGNTYYALSQHQKAVETWRHALDLDPMNETARRGLRMFQQDEGRAAA